MRLVGAVLILVALTSCEVATKTLDKTSFDESVKTKEIVYTDGNLEMYGYLASPKVVDGEVPAILVVHEWWGQTDYPRKKARELAEMGYIAMAVDMYGKGKTVEHPKSAGEFSQKLMKDLPLAKARFQAALEAIKKQDHVDSERINAIGYCFGGAIVLTMAREGLDLKSVISLHGSLPTNAFKARNVKANVLVLNGAEDEFVTASQLKEFKKQMRKIPTEFKFVNLEGAMHGFSNPEATAKGKKFDLPLKYNVKADQASWADLKSFLAESN